MPPPQRRRWHPILFLLALAAPALAACGAASPAAPPTPEPTPRVVSNLRYASTPGVDPDLQSLDLYLPAVTAGTRPILAFVHGGGWQDGDESAIQRSGMVEGGLREGSRRHPRRPTPRSPPSSACRETASPRRSSPSAADNPPGSRRFDRASRSRFSSQRDGPAPRQAACLRAPRPRARRAGAPEPALARGDEARQNGRSASACRAHGGTDGPADTGGDTIDHIHALEELAEDPG